MLDAVRRSTLFSLLVLAGAILLFSISGTVLCLGREADTPPVRYFSMSQFADLPFGTELVSQFEKDLHSLGEPSFIGQRGDEDFSLRATWFSSFQGIALLRIKACRTGPPRFFYKRRVPGASMSDSKTTVRTGTLPQKSIARLKAKAATLHFFDLDNRQKVTSTDGIYLLVEIKDGKRYHVVLRTIPFAAPVDDIAKLVERLSGVHVDLDTE